MKSGSINPVVEQAGKHRVNQLKSTSKAKVPSDKVPSDGSKAKINNETRLHYSY